MRPETDTNDFISSLEGLEAQSSLEPHVVRFLEELMTSDGCVPEQAKPRVRALLKKHRV